jgi:hypothetical protein
VRLVELLLSVARCAVEQLVPQPRLPLLEGARALARAHELGRGDLRLPLDAGVAGGVEVADG